MTLKTKAMLEAMFSMLLLSAFIAAVLFIVLFQIASQDEYQTYSNSAYQSAFNQNNIVHNDFNKHKDSYY